MKIIFVIIIFLLAVWRVKKGFQNGMMREIVNILSITVSCVCVALVFLTISSAMARTFSTLMVCIVGLIGIGIVFKICNLIFKPIGAITNISIIGGLDKMLGAVMGLGEAIIFICFLYRALDYVGIFIF